MKLLYSAVYGDDFPFYTLFDEGKSQAVTEPAEMMEFDSALVIWGGSDISPDFYGHPLSRRCAPYAGRRDRVEWALLREAIDMEIPIIGVCRGAQMLCAMAGGYLLQDVNGHAGPHHEVTTYEGKKFMVNSLHHQMMAGLEKTEHELIAWTEGRRGAPYIYRDDKLFQPEDTWKEPEFVYFPKINGYAVQWHPEMMEENTPATEYILEFIRTREAARASTRFFVNEREEMVKP